MDGLWERLSPFAEEEPVARALEAGNLVRANGYSDDFIVQTICAHLPPEVRKALQLVSPINPTPVASTTGELSIELSFILGPSPATEAQTFLDRLSEQVNAAHGQAVQF